MATGKDKQLTYQEVKQYISLLRDKHIPEFTGGIKMTSLARTVTNEALSLPPLERAGLIEELLSSFDRQSREAVDRVWSIEAERRIDAYDSGEATAISLAESRARINSR